LPPLNRGDEDLKQFNKNLLYELKMKMKLMEFKNFYIIILDIISQSSQVAATVGHPNKKSISITPALQKWVEVMLKINY
jgi:hypothetical protein